MRKRKKFTARIFDLFCASKQQTLWRANESILSILSYTSAKDFAETNNRHMWAEGLPGLINFNRMDNDREEKLDKDSRDEHHIPLIILAVSHLTWHNGPN